MNKEKQVLTVGTKEIPCTVQQMNLKEYVKVSKVVSGQKVTPEEWESLFVFLGAEKSELDEMEVEEFGEKVLEFVVSMRTSKTESLEIEDLEINGVTYSVELKEDGKIKISNILRKNAKDFIKGEEGSTYACAVFYQDKSKNTLANASEKEIEKRKKLFEKMPCTNFIPFMGKVMNRFAEVADARIKALEELENEEAKETEVTE